MCSGHGVISCCFPFPFSLTTYCDFLSEIIARAAEPFGDEAKRHARLALLQRNVEIKCSGVTNRGVITGQMSVGSGGQRRDFSLEMVNIGLATVDQHRIDYGEASKELIDAQEAAKKKKIAIWSLKQKVQEVRILCQVRVLTVFQCTHLLQSC